MIYSIAFGVGFKCPPKIHLNTQWGGGANISLHPSPWLTHENLGPIRVKCCFVDTTYKLEPFAVLFSYDIFFTQTTLLYENRMANGSNFKLHSFMPDFF